MMEKDFTEQQLDRLIQDWTDELLPQDVDTQITESLMNFVDNDDIEIDVKDLLDFHIHQLAMEEKMTKRRKWKFFVSSVAAASIVILIVTAIFISKHKFDSHSDMEALIVENNADYDPIVINKEIPMIIPDSSNMILAKATIKKETEIASNSKRKRAPVRKALKQKEDITEQKLIEAIAEINAGLDNMVDNAKECMRMTDVSLLPENLFSDINESDSFESISDEYSSSRHSGQMKKLNIIETNLINALYEIRNLNIELNFEKENIKTEI